jgi:hypothetical protein
MSNLLTVKQFAEHHPAFSEASLRYHIFHEETNGLSSALVRVGRKILIKEDAFFDWIESLQENKSLHEA